MSPQSFSDIGRIQQVSCPPPTRSRPGDRLMETFLHAWQAGRYAHSVTWPSRNSSNAEVLAADEEGARLAVQVAGIGAAENPLEAQDWLQPVAEALAAEPALARPDRSIQLLFHPQFLTKALARHPDLVCQTLRDWAGETLPALAGSRSFRFRVAIPLPSGKSGRVRVDVQTGERRPGMPAVAVAGYRPDDPERLGPVLGKVLAKKLPQLVAAEAGRRVLLLESATAATGSPRQVIASIDELAEKFPLLERLDALVVASTGALGAEGLVRFWCWRPGTADFSEILEVTHSALPAPIPAAGPLGVLSDQANQFAAAAKAPNTLRAYAADWADFRNWCEAHQLSPLPAAPETITLYLTDRAATCKTSSLARRLTTINRAHQAAGQPSPANMQNALVSEVWKGIRRTKGTAREGKKPLLTADLKRILAGLPDTLQGARDRALLLAGFAGGFRRSELARLEVTDLAETADGFVVTLRKSKTDPEGQGRAVALPFGSDPLTCPVRTLKTWLQQAKINSGPVFRAVDALGLVSDQALCPDSVAWILKRDVRRVGFEALPYAGHSLRAGLATQAAINGAGELAIMKQTGHRSLATLRQYIRDGVLFRDNAASKLGL